MSNMAVATNVLALNSHRNLKGVGNKQAQASQRLSSGYRINSAADDAAGLAISEKMRAQIRGLDQASTNAQDAISLIQTAEGGMQEIDNMIQRIRELVVQASNDTNDFSTDDRDKIQDEINQLLAEIDSMSSRVEFNQKAVIDGSYAGSLKNVNIQTTYLTNKAANDTARAAYDTALNNASQAEENVVNAQSLLSEEIARGLSDLATFSSADFYDTIMNNLNSLAAAGNATVTPAIIMAVDAAVKDFVEEYDKFIELASNVQTDGQATAAKAQGDAAHGKLGDITTALAGAAAAASVSTTLITSTTALLAPGGKAITALNTGGRIQTAAENNDTMKTRLANAKTAVETRKTAYDTAAANYKNARKNFISAERDGGLYFQIGANAHQGINVTIGSVKTDILGIGNGSESGVGTTIIDINKRSGEQITYMLDIIDDALSYVTTQRSKLGAVQNRLEYTINSLDISSENLSAAESRIRDTDMAKEMMNLTQANVLQQAATSMLAQANSAPQNILQLLQ